MAYKNKISLKVGFEPYRKESIKLTADTLKISEAEVVRLCVDYVLTQPIIELVAFQKYIQQKE